MNSIKTIGGAGGVFHIFVPGLFLLLNFVAALYLFPLTDTLTREQIVSVFRNPATGLTITIGFGYLIGVVLRIFRCESADQWSAWFLRRFDKNAKPPKRQSNLYAYERFPFAGWTGEISRRLPDDAQNFYSKLWANGNSGTFFNFAKVLIISEDERAANEIYSAEALCRYISGMLYALIVASGLLLVVLFSRLFLIHETNLALVLLQVGYIAAILGILRNFRFVRLKEVHTVFFAAYKNQHLFAAQSIKNEEKKVP